MRLQRKFCNRILSQKVLKDEISMGPSYQLEISNSSFGTLVNESIYYCITWYEVNGMRYNRKSVLMHDLIDEVPQLCFIGRIIVFQNEICFFTLLFEKLNILTHI